MEALDRHPDAGRASSVLLRYVQQPRHVAAALAAVRRMPRVGELLLEDDGLASLGFVDQMVAAGFGAGNGQLTRLHVGASNPAATLTLLRPYAAHRIPSLDVFNDVGITPGERRVAAAMFAAVDAVVGGGGRGQVTGGGGGVVGGGDHGGGDGDRFSATEVGSRCRE